MVKEYKDKLTRSQYQADKKRRHLWRPFAIFKRNKNQDSKAQIDSETTSSEEELETTEVVSPLSREEKINVLKHRLNFGIIITTVLIIVVILVLFLIK